ncbi:MAG: hydantoinase/oxoprolinase family protein [Sulfolobus sp.]|nr:hydantoinase/oxoprolinase family protein [Sulfolobus sp.]
MSLNQEITISIDIGGTFTDIIIQRGDKLEYIKVPSTPKKPEEAVINVLTTLKGEKIAEVLHATTIATNAILGQVGLELPKTALITTKGFKDIIEIGRQNRPRVYDLNFEKPKPLVPRESRYEVDERTLHNGEILKKLQKEEVEKIALDAISKGIVAIAISLLHSYINSENEKIAEEVLSKYFKYISPSYRVAPEPREYERTSTTVVNAVLMPIVSKYMNSLNEALNIINSPPLYIMASTGGLVDTTEASERPVQIIESGPAAGVIAVRELARELQVKNAISFDMGGTTAKAGTIVNYEAEITTEYEVGGEAHHGRIVKGSGYPIRFPFIDLAEVSAGGGTIIWKDEAGAINVGPLSAGADPGPICYNKGGDKPTITDANLILGRIPEKLLGGKMRIYKELAIKGLSILGDPYDIAQTSLSLINLEMARAIRLVTIERGLDPTEFSLFAFGGAGPQHALDLAEEINIKSVYIPIEPGLFSALGLLMSDEMFEARRSYPKDVQKEFDEMEKELSKKLRKIDYFLRYADVRYEGQGWELTIPVEKNDSYETIKERFNEKHLNTYGFKLDRNIEIVTLRTFAVVKRVKPKVRNESRGHLDKPRDYRNVFFNGEWIETPIYWREDLLINLQIDGPAIIEEYSSTSVIKPGWKVRVLENGVLEVSKSG